MESQLQNPEFRNNPENFTHKHDCSYLIRASTFSRRMEIWLVAGFLMT